MAADRRWKSALSLFIAMFRSLGIPSRRRLSAEPSTLANAADAAHTHIDLTDPEDVQLVHDLRNELTLVALLAHVMENDRPHDRANRLRELQRSTDRGLRLVNTLLVDARQRHSTDTIVDVNQVVRQAAATLSSVPHGAIRLQLDLSSQPIAVAAEPGALERIVLNLVLNARDAMPEGGVLTVETGLAYGWGESLEAVPSAPYGYVTVSDTGCGMTREVQDRMFDAFFTTKQNGTGLGLRSVAITVEQLHGRISVQTEPGRGTSVTVMLPLANESAPRDASSSHDTIDSRD